MSYEGVAISLISVLVGSFLTNITNRCSRREFEQGQINNYLHALYFEIEENLTYCTNLKEGNLALVPLKTEGYVRFKLSNASLQIRGELLGEIMICYLKIQNFNAKANFCEGRLLNPEIERELDCLTDAIAGVQNTLCTYLINKKMLSIKKGECKN